jgi:hypothetical protein
MGLLPRHISYIRTVIAWRCLTRPGGAEVAADYGRRLDPAILRYFERQFHVTRNADLARK